MLCDLGGKPRVSSAWSQASTLKACVLSVRNNCSMVQRRRQRPTMRHASARSLTLSVVSDRQRAMTTPGGIDIASVHKGQCDRSRHLSSGLAVTPLARTVLLKKLQSAAWLLKSCNFCSGNGFTAWRRASCDAPWTSPCRRCGRQPGRLAHRSCGADLSGRASELAILAATAVKSAPPAMASIVPDRRMSAGGVRRYLAELARWPLASRVLLPRSRIARSIFNRCPSETTRSLRC
jgi:hypothetical protein